MATRSDQLTAAEATTAPDMDPLLQQLPIGVLVAEAPLGRITGANRAAADLWGTPMPGAESTSDYSTAYTGFRPNGRQYAPDEWPLARAVLHGEVVADEEIEFLLDSGERRIMLVSAAPVRDESGVILRAVALFRDITEARNEERRREFLMQLTDELRMLDDPQSVMETAAVATGEQLGVSTASYADVDAAARYALVHAEYRNGRVIHSGKYYLEDFGSELAGRIREGGTVVVDDIQADPRPMKDVFEGWGLRALIAAPVVRQGKLVALFSVLHNAPRRWTRSDVALVEHVAERTWLTVESARLQAELKQSREWLTLALRAGSAATWDWNLRTGEIEWSEDNGVLQDLMPTRRSLTFSRWLSLVHPDDRPAAREIAQRIAAMRDGELEFEHRLAGGGPARWVTMRGRVMPDARGAPLRVVGIATDTTERKNTELEREALLDQAREASDAKSNFIGVISHEFRTPLTAIIGYADLLSTGVSGELSPAQARQLDRVRASAWHLTEMVDEILTFSRIEAGRETVTFGDADVVALARETAALVGPGAAARNLGLACELPDEGITLRTDSGKLRQILLNLLGNAVKFTDKGGIRLQVRRFPDAVEFTVVDTGNGISGEDVERIFDRFWQAARGTTRTAPGAGLGLTVSRHLAELLGGAITVESEPGLGSTFRLRLPA
ncbi:MAG: ATP-binding protein [Gemmatimonadota bacterium]